MPTHPTFQYKWPSKVLRYKISCPLQRLLIAKHESQIDWSGHRIESGEALDRYLREVMLPDLKDCITPDHPKSHYCKSIHLKRMLANSDLDLLIYDGKNLSTFNSVRDHTNRLFRLKLLV